MNCIICNKELNKNSKYYCSHLCQKEHQYQKYITNWLYGNESGTRNIKPCPSKYVYKYLYRAINKCEICGLNSWNNQKIILEVDHINGNRADNSRNNLRLLCPNCHSQTPTFRNKSR